MPCIARAPAALALTWPDASERVERDLSSTDPTVRRAAVDKLRGVSAKGATPLILRALGDPSVEVRIEAARVAVSKRLAAATAVVLPWLAERDARLRTEACEVAGELPDPSSVPHLARALGDSEAGVRAAAARALGQQASRDATPPLLGRLDDGSPAVRIQVVRALGALGDPRAVVPLVGKAEDSVLEVRQAVARALGELGDTRAAPALILQLKDASADVKASAITALGLLHATEATDALVQLASDKNASLRRVAVEAMGRIGGPDAVRALISLLGTGDDAEAGTERSPARDALATIGPAAVPALRATLTGASAPRTASGAAWVLGELGARETAPDLVAAMRRGTLDPAAALHALAALGDSASIAVALEFVDDPNPAARREALRATAALLDPSQPDGRALEPLAAALKDPKITRAERAEVVALLGKTGAPRAEPLLRSLLASKDVGIKLAAIDALGALGPAGQDDALLEELKDPDAAVRLHAALSIGRSGGAAARDALVLTLTRGTEIDRASTLTALSGVMARVPSDAAVRALHDALGLAADADRDGIILAMGRADLPASWTILREVKASPSADDRRTLAASLSSRRGDAATTEMLSALLADPDPSVAADAAWSLGEVGDATALALLARVASAPDAAPAADAAAAIARIGSRDAKPAAAAELLCKLVAGGGAFTRANAAAGLALLSARCGDGSAERALLADPSAPVRASGARAIARHPLGHEDGRALERCRIEDPSGAVAKLCRPQSGAAPGERQREPRGAVLFYVVDDAGTAPHPGATFAALFSDGLVRVGRADRRGAVFDGGAPAGEVSLLRTQR